MLVEDNRLLREGLVAVLTAGGLRVHALSRVGREALRVMGRGRPALVLLDSALPGALSFVEELSRVSPRTRVIVMGLLPAHEEFVPFVRAGVAGFILKDATGQEFVDTILAVASGRSVLPSVMTTTLFSYVAAQAAARARRWPRAAARMTARERQVIGLIAEGLSNKEIASRLRIATHTVKSHVHNILEKLALHSRLEVAAFAFDQPRASPSAGGQG